MLVLSRKRDEDVVIVVGDLEIVIKTIGVIGDKVRLGIDAPRHVAVHRREVLERIREQRKDSPAA